MGRFILCLAVVAVFTQAALGQDYAAARAEALRTGRPLVVGVGCAPPAGDWVIAFSVGLEGTQGPCVVVSRDGREWTATMPPTATAADVRQAVSRPAAPFAEPQPPTADVEASADVFVPYYMEKYDRAQYTQRIAVTNGRDSITRIPRRNLEAKWQVGGGLVGVRGWRSELYRWAPHTLWVGNIGVRNGFGSIQFNRGWRREYEDGSEFAEVLVNTATDRVFEVRKAVKEAGAWRRFVDYRNVAERPNGYQPVKSADCRACHESAGTGGYATGLVPGGDTVLSEGFPALERDS